MRMYSFFHSKRVNEGKCTWRGAWASQRPPESPSHSPSRVRAVRLDSTGPSSLRVPIKRINFEFSLFGRDPVRSGGGRGAASVVPTIVRPRGPPQRGPERREARPADGCGSRAQHMPSGVEGGEAVEPKTSDG